MLFVNAMLFALICALIFAPYNTVKRLKMIFALIFALLLIFFEQKFFLYLQIPIIIAQVGYELPKTNQEVRMTTAAGTVIQLMGSDEQFDLPVFPIVLAYNRINHYCPTQYLCDTSLSDWRLAQMYRHLVCANDFYIESQVGINDPVLEKSL